MKFSKVNFVQDINRPPEDPTPSSKENQKKQSGTNNMITTNNIALSGEKNILFIILIFCRLKTLLQKMEGNPNLSCSGPPSLIGPACFLRQIPKQLEEKKQTPLQSFPDWQKEQGLSFLGCPSSRCQLTSNRTLLPKVEMFDAIIFHQFNFDWEQGGRIWQPFVGGKNGLENFRQTRIYNFRDKCVIFARNRKFANLT